MCFSDSVLVLLDDGCLRYFSTWTGAIWTSSLEAVPRSVFNWPTIKRWSWTKSEIVSRKRPNESQLPLTSRQSRHRGHGRRCQGHVKRANLVCQRWKRMPGSVSEAIKSAFADVLDIQRPVKFAQMGSGHAAPPVNQSPVYVIRNAELGDSINRPLVRQDVERSHWRGCRGDRRHEPASIDSTA